MKDDADNGTPGKDPNQQGVTAPVGEPIIFKTEPSLWEMLKDRTKRWDARKDDINDDRMYRLRWVGEVDEVTFENNKTGAMLHIEFKGIEYAPWSPGWAFLILGDIIDIEDHQGPEELPVAVCGNEWCPTCMNLR